MGIHELTEDECLEVFPVVQQGIAIMLEQKSEAIERAEREREAAEAIRKVAGKPKNPVSLNPRPKAGPAGLAFKGLPTPQSA